MTPGTLVRLRRPVLARDLRKLARGTHVEVEPEVMRVRAVWGSHVDLERPLSKRQAQVVDELMVLHVPLSSVGRV